MTPHDVFARGQTQNLQQPLGLPGMIGTSPAFRAMVDRVLTIAQIDRDMAVLVFGETGTGKGLCAQALHRLSSRSTKPFVRLNCGTLPNDQFETELFGHAEGAIAGAVWSTGGLLAQADGGTLFLGEVDAMAPSTQVKLLRFLQAREHGRFGIERWRLTDVRIITSASTDLHRLMREGKFRADLYSRLAFLQISVPPLRDRGSDITLLAQHFVTKSVRAGAPVAQLSPEARQTLVFHDWPGNVRELERVITNAVIFSKEPQIQPKDLALPNAQTPRPQVSFTTLKALAVANFEKQFVSEMMRHCQNNVSQAAATAGLDLRTFSRLLRKHGLKTHAPPGSL